MKRLDFYCLCAFFLMSLNACQAQEPEMVLNIDLASHKADVSPSMYGIFFEEICHSGDGGLYGEMLMNRSFEERVLPEGGYRVENGELIPPQVINHLIGKPTIGRFEWGTDPYPGWELVQKDAASVTATLVTEQPNFKTAPTSMKVEVAKLGEGVSLVNKGYWGIALQKDASYKLRMFVRNTKSNGELKVRLLGKDDRELGQASFTLTPGTWREYKATIEASDTTSVGRLSIDLPAEDTYYFDYVSLFPEDTYKGRENGMRKDVAQMLEGLRPAFIRWPGGCIVEGITLSNRVEWKKTLGDPASRPGMYDTWGYHNTYGFGYKEFLDFCEDIGAKGMYVCNVGIACQARTGEACSDKEAEAYLEDALDAIEYAIGDTDTEWGAVRAKEGHPAPYPLAYVEIGNENSGPVYDRRFNMFYDAIKAKYPQLILISNHGVGGIGEAHKTDMIDPHWYVEAESFFKNTDMFDKHERGRYKIYVGEYACFVAPDAGTMLAALSEAAFMTGMERNGDLVTMTSYAPLLENRNDCISSEHPITNLIGLSNNQVVGRSSYYVQKIFSENRPTYILDVKDSVKPEIEKETFINYDGYIGMGTWSTQTQFRNLKVTDMLGKVIEADMTDSTQWKVIHGDWEQVGGVYTQTGNENLTALLWKSGQVNKGSIIEFEVNKLGGSEGFLLYFGLKDLNLKKGYVLNVGGWNNSFTALEKLVDNNASILSNKIEDQFDMDNWHKVRIVISEYGANYYIDGKQILSHQNAPLKRKFYVAGYDEKSEEVVVKVVNASEYNCLAQINLFGGEIKKDGRIITLSATSKQEENSFQEPFKIIPKETTYNKFSTSFKYEFKPNSITILRMKKK